MSDFQTNKEAVRRRGKRRPNAGPIQIDIFLVEGFMLFPNDLDLARTWYRINERNYVIEKIGRLIPGRVDLSQHDFDVLAQDFRAIPSKQDVETRRRAGWVVSALFHFLLSGKGIRPMNIRPEEESSYDTSIRKAPLHLERLAKLGGGLVPGTELRRAVGEETIKRASHNLWSSAHYWAAMYNDNGELRFPEPRDGVDWVSFMRLTETFRVIGIAFGIFQALAPARSYDESKLVSDPRFEPYERIVGASLSKVARDDLSNYVSRKTILKHKRPRKK